MKKVLNYFVQDKEACLRASTLSVQKLAQMKQLAAGCGMPVEDIEFMADTFGILALARDYYFQPFTAYFMHVKWDWSKLYFLMVPVFVLAPMLVFALLPDIVLYWQNMYRAVGAP